MPFSLVAAAASAVISTWWATPVVVLTSDDCPSPEAVASELRRLAPNAGLLSPESGGTIEIDERGDQLRIRRIDAGGTVVFERAVRPPRRCEDRATAVAALLAASALDAASYARPPHAPMTPRPPAMGDLVDSSEPLPSARLSLSATSGLIIAGVGGAAPGFGLGLAFANTDGTRGLRMRFDMVTGRETALGAGSVRWTRYGQRVDAFWRPSRAALAPRLVAGIAFAVTPIAGHGFDRNYDHVGWSAGPAFAVELDLATVGDVSLGLALGSIFWPAPRSITVTDTAAPMIRKDLPRVEAEVLVAATRPF